MSEFVIPSNNWLGTLLECTETTSSVGPLGAGDSFVITLLAGSRVYLAIGDPTIQADPTGWILTTASPEARLTIDPQVYWYNTPWIAGICEAGQTATVLIHRVARVTISTLAVT